jgi:hypothetical protein
LNLRVARVFRIMVRRRAARNQGAVKLQEVLHPEEGRTGQVRMRHRVTTVILVMNFQEDRAVRQAIRKHQETEVPVGVPHQTAMVHAEERIPGAMNHREAVNSRAWMNQDEEVKHHVSTHRGVETSRAVTTVVKHQDANQVTTTDL